MPIRAERKHLYPRDWKSIRAHVLERAKHRCEGSPAYPECRAINYHLHPITGSRVVLTIAHLNHDETESDPEQLRAWCQRCHLTYDAKHHAKNARVTRLLRIGQFDLFVCEEAKR